MIEKIQKNSLAIISVLAICVGIYLVFNWGEIPALQRVTSILFICVSIHTWEEKLFGFEELNETNMDSNAKVDSGIGYIMLLLLTVYVGIVPLFFTNQIWLATSILILGFVEVLAHTAAIRMKKNNKGLIHGIYNAGMATAYTILPLCSIWGFYVMNQEGLFSWANVSLGLLNLFVPLIVAQAIAVKSSGASYGVFLKNTISSMRKKK
ncbi:Uncharacterised protein [Streptococcus gallolyticus]|uniref:HXXEE domain-containing protein n=1 Tax=Streptococcus gallolyticus TaxID=315405 RepID=A0AA94S979_9STRE|nr:HXXEE domain-containing protein [Streptococcus gallolyticus]AQP41295.1 hypothetical protein BTR42_01480 [Streptococcus gallolyticus subsp. gallolyticus DSM 16831]SQG78574.1 Uncharacterised protein [Streptococcus gallolyticus]